MSRYPRLTEMLAFIIAGQCFFGAGLFGGIRDNPLVAIPLIVIGSYVLLWRDDFLEAMRKRKPGAQ